MTGPELARMAALGVGGFQVLANAAMLVRGPLRIRAELRAGAVTERFADLLSVAWVYGTVANICVAVVLLMIAAPLRDRDFLSWCIALLAGLYYVAVGSATFALGIRRHAGLLVFVLIGAALLIPLWSARASYVR